MRRHTRGRPRAAEAVAALTLIAATVVSPTSLGAKEIRARRVQAPPVIDGVLTEPCWQEAETAGEFFLRHGDGDVPTQETVVRVCHDATTLYVAFECLEDQMEELSAAIAQRDARALGEDDMVAISLDTFRDGRSSYVFACSALGTEKDFHVSECGRSVDVGWDAVWSVVTGRLDDRWIAEIAIPFAELRYGTGEEQVWGVDFRRSERPSREFSSWSNADGPTLDPSYYGTLVGLSGIESSHGLRLLPFFLGKYDVSDAYDYPLEPSDSDWDVHPDLGLDVEYDPFPNATVNLTLNPDFAQIEADPSQINLSGNELWLEERRPFFSENADVFHMPLPLLYTRRMEDILYGGKVTGKAGGARFAALHARSDDLPRDDYGDVMTDALDEPLDPGTNDYTALIYRQDLWGSATLGLFGATRERDDGHSRVGALTGGVGLFDNLRLTGLAAGSSNTGDLGDDGAGAIDWSYEKPDWNSEGEIEWIGARFNPETGFVRPDWRGRRGINGHLWRGYELADTWVDRFDLTGWAGRYEALDGDLRTPRSSARDDLRRHEQHCVGGLDRSGRVRGVPQLRLPAGTAGRALPTGRAAHDRVRRPSGLPP